MQVFIESARLQLLSWLYRCVLTDTWMKQILRYIVWFHDYFFFFDRFRIGSCSLCFDNKDVPFHIVIPMPDREDWKTGIGENSLLSFIKCFEWKSKLVFNLWTWNSPVRVMKRNCQNRLCPLVMRTIYYQRDTSSADVWELGSHF